MAIVTANITAGAYTRSELVTVTVAGAGAVSVVVCRGEFVLGTAVTVGGVAQVAVPPLAAVDIIQASVTERGNQAGVPVRVLPNPSEQSGWVIPKTLTVTNLYGGTTTLTREQYIAQYGDVPGALFDPIGAGAVGVPPEYDTKPGVELGFDVEQVQQAGSTTLRVVPRNGEGILVGWNGAVPGSAAPLTVTTSGNVTVAVVRDNAPAQPLSRLLPVVVLPAPTAPSTPAPGDITSAAWRNYGNGYIRAMINCPKPCEAQLVGYDSSWKVGTAREPTFIEVDWSGPVPNGTYTCNCRVVGETNPANYVSFIIKVN